MAKTKVPQAATIGLDAAKLYRALDAERKRRGMSLEETATKLDVSYATMGTRRLGGGMRADVAVRIALFLGRDLRMFAKYPPADPLPRSRDTAAA